MNDAQKIELNFDWFSKNIVYDFNTKEDFILCDKIYKCIYLYPTKTNRWICRKIYKAPKKIEFIDMKGDKIHLTLNNSIYELNIFNKNVIKVLSDKKKVTKILK